MITPEYKQREAANPATLPHILAQLIHDEDDYTAILASKNPNTPVKALWSVVDSPTTSYLVYGVAGNPNTPADLLDYISYKEDFRLKEIIATNPNTAAKTLQKMINPKLPIYILTNVANHPNIPVEITFMLLSHSDKDVRTAAYYSPKTPEDLKPTAIFYGGVYPESETPYSYRVN